MRVTKLIVCAIGALTITTSVAGTALANATPITHLVVIFENISFDHYFGTYPNATNPSGESPFTARPNTPSVNALTGGLLSNNPNLSGGNNSPTNSVASNPFRLDISQAATADQDHDYGPEQTAFDHGLMDLFPLSVGSADPAGRSPFASYDHCSYDGLLRW